MTKKKKRKLKISGVIYLLSICFIIGYSFYYVFSLPVKNILVKGNNLISENEILEVANIKDKKIIEINTHNLKKKLLKKYQLIDNIKVSKNFLGKVVFTINESKILFFDNIKGKFITNSSKEINDNNKYMGYPTLISSLSKDIYENLITAFDKVDRNVLLMISEIEYSPNLYNDIVIDNERFLLKMNDGNKVYINLVNIEKLNKYQDIYISVGNNGTLFLDSNSKTYIFEKSKTNDGDEVNAESENEAES